MIKYNIAGKVYNGFAVLGCILLLLSWPALAGNPQRELLWPLGAPEAKGDDPERDRPSITIYSPSDTTTNGTAVVICPGGGYGFLAVEPEGRDIAKWLNTLGIAFGEPYTHQGLQRNLIGDNPSEALVVGLSNEKQVTKDTPPTFLFHTDEDRTVPAENSVAFYLALRKAKVPAELHIYRKGRHGLNLARNVQGTSGWPKACEEWLRGQGLVHDSTVIDPDTVKQWSAPYRGWHYYPDHVIPAKPNIEGFGKVYMTDVPTVFQLPEDEKWYMTFIGFDGEGYQSFVAESDDLVHWTHMRLAMGYGPKDSFDYGGAVLGAFLYGSYAIQAPRILKRRNGKYFSLYGAYPRQGGFELRPGYEGIASSEDGLAWQRAKDEPILSVHQPDCRAWEKDCIYQPWLVGHGGRFFNFYNAANGHVEQLGLALSDNLLDWKRYKDNPVIPVGPKGSCNEVFSSDGKVFRDKDHWINFFFGVNAGGAHIMAAFSRDLYHWTVDPDPLYKSGGNPSGLDQEYAHKISLVWNPANETYYMFYTAVGNKGRGIGLITSRPLKQEE